MGQKLNEMPCPKCRKPVNVSATRCPHCHADYSEAEIAARRTEHKQTLTGGCVLLVVVILGLSWCTARDSETDLAEANEEPAQMVEAVASREDQKSRFLALYRKVAGMGKECDAANSVAVSSMGQISGGDASLYEAFAKVDRAENLCGDTVSAFRAISTDSGYSSDVRSIIDKALDRCKSAYEARVSGLQTVKLVMDGDSRPSLVQSFKDDQEIAKGGVLLCVAGLTDAGLKLGLKADEMEKAVRR